MFDQNSNPSIPQQDLEGPDELGHFGPYGGVFVGETLISAVE